MAEHEVYLTQGSVWLQVFLLAEFEFFVLLIFLLILNLLFLLFFEFPSLALSTSFARLFLLARLLRAAIARPATSFAFAVFSTDWVLVCDELLQEFELGSSLNDFLNVPWSDLCNRACRVYLALH